MAAKEEKMRVEREEEEKLRAQLLAKSVASLFLKQCTRLSPIEIWRRDDAY